MGQMGGWPGQAYPGQQQGGMMPSSQPMGFQPSTTAAMPGSTTMPSTAGMGAGTAAMAGGLGQISGMAGYSGAMMQQSGMTGPTMNASGMVHAGGMGMGMGMSAAAMGMANNGAPDVTAAGMAGYGVPSQAGTIPASVPLGMDEAPMGLYNAGWNAGTVDMAGTGPGGIAPARHGMRSMPGQTTAASASEHPRRGPTPPAPQAAAPAPPPPTFQMNEEFFPALGSSAVEASAKAAPAAGVWKASKPHKEGGQHVLHELPEVVPGMKNLSLKENN